MEATPIKTLKCAFIRSSSLGDIVLATACLQLLKKLKIKADVYWIGTKPNIELIKTSYPEVATIELIKNNLIPINTKDLTTLKDLDFVLDLQVNARSKILCYYLKLRNKTKFFRLQKFRLKRQKLILNARFNNRSQPIKNFAGLANSKKQFLNNIELLNVVLKKLGYPYENPENLATVAPKLEIPEKSFNSFDSDINFGTWIAVAPGAKYFSKRAPLEIFLSVLDNIFYKIKVAGINPNDIGIVTLGDASERALCANLLEKISWGSRKINYAGKISLIESAAVLSKCSMTLSNDTALAHLSEAVQTPTSVLFGPTTEAFGFAPHLNDSKAYSVDLGCRPCSKHGSLPCRFHDYLCFKNLHVAEIADNIAKKILHNER